MYIIQKFLNNDFSKNFLKNRPKFKKICISRLFFDAL